MSKYAITELGEAIAEIDSLLNQACAPKEFDVTPSLKEMVDLYWEYIQQVRDIVRRVI